MRHFPKSDNGLFVENPKRIGKKGLQYLLGVELKKVCPQNSTHTECQIALKVVGLEELSCNPYSVYKRDTRLPAKDYASPAVYLLLC